MSPVIALLRHADYHQPLDVPSAHLPYALTDTGVAQARAAAATIADFAAARSLEFVHTIDSSHMLRAWQTASEVARVLTDATGTEFVIAEYDELAERSVGSAANLTVDEIVQVLADDPRYARPPSGWKSDSDYRLPLQGAESLMEAGERVAGRIEAAFEECASMSPAGLKIIVGHGASIRHAAIHLGLLDRTQVSGLSMYHAEPMFLSRESLSRDDNRFSLIDGEWKVRQHPQEGDEIRAR